MSTLIIPVLFVLAVIFESTLTTIPLVLLALLSLAVARKKIWIFPLGFLSGIVLDVLLVRQLGITSLFFLVFLFVILLYERKYEIRTLPFIMIASFICTFLYGLFFSVPSLFLQSVVSSLVAGVIFILFSVNRDLKDKRGFMKV